MVIRRAAEPEVWRFWGGGEVGGVLIPQYAARDSRYEDNDVRRFAGDCTLEGYTTRPLRF